MATKTQKVSFLLTAKDRTRDAFDAVDRRLDSLSRGATAIAGGALAGATVAAAGGLALLTKRAFETNDSLGKIADTIGLGTKELAGFRHAAELTGVGADAMDKALQKMQRSVGDGIRGTQTQVDAFERLGINLEEFARLDPGEQFKTVADGLGNISTRGEQAATAAAIFGREGINMLNTLELGRDGLEAITEEMDRFGVALDRADVAQIEAANDAFTRAGAAAQGVGNKIAVNLAPFVEEVANRFSQAAVETSGFETQIETAGQVGITVIGFLADRVQDLYRGFLTVRAVVAQVEATARDFFGIGDESDINDALRVVDESFAALEESIDAGRLSEKIKAEVEDIRIAAAARAKATAEAIETRNLSRQGEEAGPIGESVQEKNAARRAEERAQADAEREAQRIADRIQQLEEALLSEEEAERLSYERRRALVEENLSTEGAEAARRNELLERIEEEHRDNMKRIVESNLTDIQKLERKSQIEKIKHTTGYFSSVTAATAQHSKILFAINKAAAIADIAVNIPKTTSDAYKHGTAIGGPVVGAAFAAVAAAAQGAQMSAVLATSYTGNGGGTTPSSAGTTPVINDEPVGFDDRQGADAGSLGRSSVQVVVNGNFYGNEEAISDLMDAIEDRISNGDQVFIDPGSRQAQAIRSG